ncbi:hypothetical protein V497_01963 [Pseudogymnoascus sp. VKM F-4516 (FW-969)]|nr:hypothetical protein V497_01963 [Pseudogymnoascus sp. VKM F-4516 (FW-969)]
MKLITIALVGASAVAAASHRHMHRHADFHGSAVAKRDADKTVVEEAVVTKYEMNGKELNPEKVKQGVKDGIYILLDDVSSEAPKPTKVAAAAGEFLEQKHSTTAAPSTSVAPPPPPPTTSAAPTPSAPATGGSGATGIDEDFPSGTIDCDNFPSDYGAVEASWLKMSGWIGLQMTPNFSPGDAHIAMINTGIGGDNCKPNTFCSYACPPGYQKSQWPKSQGNTGQSIGGLYCNAQNKLELTNPELSKKICIKGTGEVKVKNTIGRNVPICRTDYPGTESETVPLDTQPGQEYELTCPDANKYYTWGDAATSAQYYINPAGSPVEDACRWNEAGSNMGNWAPVNLGVGKGPTGQTYISIFANKPTNPDGKLNFNLEITGDVSGKCAYIDGEFYNNGVVDPSGCTVLVTGTATYKIY